MMVVCWVGLAIAASAQRYWGSQTVQISFFSSTPIENIEAHSQTAATLLNTETNEIAVQININSFRFRKELMQEHFNENYLESDQFPYGTFSGKINERIDWSKAGNYNVTATGKLTIHGKTQERTIVGKLTIKPQKIIIDSQMEVLLADYNITVPKIVFQKIAERISVSLKATLTPRPNDTK